jgi:hypothetical protein
MMRVKGGDLTAEPRHETLITRESYRIVPAGVVLEGLLSDGDAHHTRAFGGTKWIAGQAPGGEDHETVVAPWHDNARVLWQRSFDKGAKLSTEILHRNALPFIVRPSSTSNASPATTAVIIGTYWLGTSLRDKPYRKSRAVHPRERRHGTVA